MEQVLDRVKAEASFRITEDPKTGSRINFEWKKIDFSTERSLPPSSRANTESPARQVFAANNSGNSNSDQARNAPRCKFRMRSDEDGWTAPAVTRRGGKKGGGGGRRGGRQRRMRGYEVWPDHRNLRTTLVHKLNPLITRHAQWRESAPAHAESSNCFRVIALLFFVDVARANTRAGRRRILMGLAIRPFPPHLPRTCPVHSAHDSHAMSRNEHKCYIIRRHNFLSYSSSLERQ